MKQRDVTLSEIARALGAELRGDGDKVITGLGTLQNASPGEISFLANRSYARYLADARAGAVLINPELADQCPTDALVMDDPYLGFARLSHWFDPEPRPESGIHPSAVVSPRASVATSAIIGPGAVVEDDAEIGDDARIDANACIGARSHVGAETTIGCGVTILHDVRIGARCRISPGAVIGSDGFGYAHAGERWERIAQLGGVIVGDDVDIGANTTIDRGALDNTIIGNGVKLDNMIQIAHNVTIGDHTAMAAMVGIAGSTRIGSHCVFGGASGVGGHLEIADHVHLTGMTMVTRSLKEPGVYSSGTGVEPNRDWRRSVVRFRQLDELVQRVKRLEKKISE